MIWRLVENDPAVPFYPHPPEGAYGTFRGILRCEGPEYNRYPASERQIGTGEVEVIVQREVNSRTNGIACWFPSPTSDVWYLQSSHFKNTLLNDPDFERVIDLWITREVGHADH